MATQRLNAKMTTAVELNVPMDCLGCEKKVKKALEKIKGVNDVQIDMKQQKATVTGWVEQKKVLKVARNITGRDVCLWPCPYNPETNGYNDRYFKKKFSKRTVNGEKVSSYNYYKHGYYGHDHGCSQHGPYVEFIDGSLFCEENPHFCAIM